MDDGEATVRVLANSKRSKHVIGRQDALQRALITDTSPRMASVVR